MVDSSLPPVPTPPPEVRKHSMPGIVSFALSIVVLGLVCVFFLYPPILGIGVDTAIYFGDSIGGLGFGCGIGVLTLVGLGLGIAGVASTGKNKVFGILGLVINALILIGFCLFTLVVFNFSLS